MLQAIVDVIEALGMIAIDGIMYWCYKTLKKEYEDD